MLVISAEARCTRMLFEGQTEVIIDSGCRGHIDGFRVNCDPFRPGSGLHSSLPPTGWERLRWCSAYLLSFSKHGKIMLH